MIKAIIFDFDGVIHDTFELFNQINKTVYPGLSSDEYRDFYNGNVFKNNGVTEETIKSFFEHYAEEAKKLKIKEAIKNELVKLNEKYEMFIVSSNMETILNCYFKNNGIDHIFTEVLGLESHKSKEEKFKLLFDKYDFNKDDYIFVTDTLGDILEATEVGLNTIAVDCGFHSRENLEKGRPLNIISDLKDLYCLLGDESGVKIKNNI